MTSVDPVALILDLVVALVQQAPELVKAVQAIMASGGTTEEQDAAIAALRSGESADKERVAGAVERDV
jgi:hypothetical protein